MLDAARLAQEIDVQPMLDAARLQEDLAKLTVDPFLDSLLQQSRPPWPGDRLERSHADDVAVERSLPDQWDH